MVPVAATLVTGGIEAYTRAYEVYTSPEFNTIRQAFANGEEAVVVIDGTEVIYDPEWTTEAMTLQPGGYSEIGGWIMGPKAFVSESELAKTILHESYRLANQDGQSESIDSTGAATNAAAEFAESNFETLMGESAGYDLGFPGSDSDGGVPGEGEGPPHDE
jgi:hypothetical protein